MLGFSGLRLSGFKSFVESADLNIQPGLTGVVGPNGCGKSNLIEALRWVMGESSARHMRGSEMDDVIFGGTAGRPARNVAEVVVRLDNSTRAAPSKFDGFDELEVSRRIERGMGSSYRINGLEVRARDVHLLFADAATGARSSGMVSQGRVGAIINARPSDRRSLLEEAAGIGGLHARRHEAEGRLTAAEGNLQRLSDVMAELTQQKAGLAKQAKQAERYRTLSASIRAVEAQALYLEWLEALTLVDAARKRLDRSSTLTAERNAAAASAGAAQSTVAAAIPELRQHDQTQAEALRALLFKRETLESESARLNDLRLDIEKRLAHAAADIEREKARSGDGERVVARLDSERKDLLDAGEGAAYRDTQAVEAMAKAQQVVAETEARMAQLLEAVAAADAERAAGLRRLNEAETRRDRMNGRLNQIAAQHAQAQSEGIDRALLTSAEMEVEAAQEFVQEAAEALLKAESERVRTREHLNAALEARAKVNAEHAKLKAETDALSAMVAGQKRGEYDPVLDKVVAQSGWELALAAALGEDLDASIANDAPHRWIELPPIDGRNELPDQAIPLSKGVTAPLALARRLAAVGVVETLDDALAAMGRLSIGQRLVTKGGDLVRWDGLTAAAGAPSPVAVRLANANRLRELLIMIEDARAGIAQTGAAVTEAEQAARQAQQTETQARDSQRRADSDLVKAQAALTQLAGRFANWEQRLAALAEQVSSASADKAEADAQWSQAHQAVEAIPSDDTGRLQVETLRSQLAGQRSSLVESRSNLDRLRREEGERVRRLETIDKDRAAWSDRIAQAGRHLVELELRKEDLANEHERLTQLPTELETKRADLLNRIAAAETARRSAADALMQAETRLTAADRDLRQAEAALHEARESQIRDEAALTGAKERTAAAAAKIAERMDVTPERLRDMAEIDPGAPPDKSAIDARLERLVRDRDAMGPVNLRAEIELKEIDDRLTTIVTEKADLEEAIHKLRRAIADLNAEGRERLKASFQEVDAHFRDLFVRLFGGGRAHLALVESDDPLQAGLEIMASPPGKRLQILSLLSGGEQALTALALLFAVFMTNPAPICVLDEVDAPLDDANVDRFCTLVEGIAKDTGTKFMIVTHHRMTMARMHRLYGVTMAERGVSQLVSVDLEQAVAVRDSIT